MKKILVVAMVDSIHTARWLEQFEDNQNEFLLFPSSPHRRIHPRIRRLLGDESTMTIRIPRGLGRTGLLLAAIDKLVNNRVRGFLLRKNITGFQPEILHAMETQGAGYISLQALTRSSLRPFFILTLWGSDLFWFRQFSRHQRKLTQLLKMVDRLAMECERDSVIARSLGFAGSIYPPIPVTGGYEVDQLASQRGHSKPSSRKLIMIKGHTRFVGQAETALAAIEQMADLLTSYQLIVYSADPKAKRIALKLKKQQNLSVEVFGRAELSHDRLLELFSSARIYVGISSSDGISVSLQEAMVCGAFPIQTDTSCANEWIEDSKSGFIVKVDDLPGMTRAIKTALENDALVDSAAELNLKTAQERLDQKVVSELSRNFYEKVLG